MKFRLRKGKGPLIVLIAIGLALSGLGFWWWDSKVYPLPDHVERWVVSKEPTRVGLCRLRYWKEFRITRKGFRKAELEEGEWNFALENSGSQNVLSGVINFRGDEVIFDVPIPLSDDRSLQIAEFFRSESGVIMRSGEEFLVELKLSDEMGVGSEEFLFLTGDWEGREIRVWGFYGDLMHRVPPLPAGSGGTPSPAVPPRPRR